MGGGTLNATELYVARVATHPSYNNWVQGRFYLNGGSVNVGSQLLMAYGNMGGSWETAYAHFYMNSGSVKADTFNFTFLINKTSAGAVSGIFNNLPEGAEAAVGDGTWRITYEANYATGLEYGGNDVALVFHPGTTFVFQ